MSSQDFRPTLLVGVGGTGIDIAERVFKRAKATEQGKRGRIGVLSFDTDSNDMRRLRAVEERQQVRFSSSDTIYQLLSKNPEFEATWFGPRGKLSHDVLNMTLLDGAAQIRLLTRLGLQHSLKRGGVERQIGEAAAQIAALNGRETFDGAINVMLVGSLAGATGSGSFIQIALLIGAVCRERNITADIRGLFLLPDVFARGANLPTDQIANVLANGYASLKELNAVNNFVTERGDTTPFVFEYAPGRTLQQGGIPFRNLALIDFENTRGGSFGRSLDAYKEMAARAAFLLIFTPIGQKTASVSVNDARAKMAAASAGTHNLYAGIGVSSIEYPAGEMANYLKLRLAAENLGGDWLRLDRGYFERMRRYEDQRRLGNLSAVRPDQGQAFLEDLGVFATKDRLPFFAEIHARLYPKIRDERSGNDVLRPRAAAFLDAVLAEIAARFWSRERLGLVAKRQIIDSAQLRNKTALPDTVRRLENQLDDDLAQIDASLATVPEDDFLNILLTADDTGEGQWRDYHIQTYIIRGAPHLVEVRAFLYDLRREIGERRGQIDALGARSMVMRASNVFDDTRDKASTERRSPKTATLARQVAERGLIAGLLKGSYDQFTEDYATYFNGSLTAMRKFATLSIEAKAMDLLDDEAQGLERYLAGLFVELGAVFDRLSQDIAIEETRHGGDGGIIDGNVWVFAHAAAKKATWTQFSEQSAALHFEDEANSALAKSVYQRYRLDRRARKTTDFNALGKLFTQAIVEDFGGRAITTDFRNMYDFSVLEAVKRDAALKKMEWQAELRRLVDLVGAQSEPFLTLTDANDGQRVIFWAINDKLREELNDDALYNGLFTFNQGEQPLEGEEFSAQTLLCMNSRVNLELEHFAKLYPGTGLGGRLANINVPGLGSYAKAYGRMVDGLIDAEIDGGARSVGFTPHLDAAWHRPGALPEIFPELTRNVRAETARAFVVALGAGLLSFVQEWGVNVTEFSTVGRMQAAGLHSRIADTHDIWSVLLSFEVRADVVRAALRYWADLRKQVAEGPRPEPDPLKVLSDPNLVKRLLRVAVTRSAADQRDDRTTRLLAAWAYLLRDVVALCHPELASPGQAQIADAAIETCRTTALAELAESGVREETQRVLERLFGKALEPVRP